MMRSELKHVVADSRTSQELEPLRVPVKLQDRFERAHKRMANKDGFLFTSAATPSRESAKKHLPDVILRNKMMAFESKWQCTNKSSLLYDPLDASFERLSMEEREEVMNRIQTRVERITDAVEDKYRRKKQQLDDQGVFDPAINTRRVQAMYLVDLQRQCNLDLLKTQVLQEFDQERQPLFAGSFGQKPSSATAPVHVLGTLLQDAEPPIQELRGSKKLQRLLRSHSMAKSTSEPLLERRKSVRSGSITVATPSNNTPSNTGASHTAPADVATPPVASSNNPPPPGRASQSDNDPRHVAMARHPEIASVVASLRATDAVAKLLKKRSKTAFRPGQDMAAKPDNAVDEWKDQVDLFGQIGARCSASLRRRATAQLADITATPPSFPQLWSRLAPFTADLRERRSNAKSNAATLQSSTQPSYANDSRPADERLSTRKATTTAQYSQWQDAIGRRRRKLAKLANDATSVVNSTVSGQQQPTPANTTVPDSMALPPALQRRPSTILDDRQNKHARRKPTVASGMVIGRPREVASGLKHTTKRVLRRQMTAISWEWLTPEPIKPSPPPTTKATPPVAAAANEQPNQDTNTSPARGDKSPGPHRSSILVHHQNNSMVDSHEVLQRRLEEVWLRLGMPYHLKLNMLEKYASHDGAGALHTAIDLWEAATDMVVLREALVVMGTHAQRDLVPEELELYWTQLQACSSMLLPLPSSMPTMQVFGPWVESLVPLVTAKCRQAIEALGAATGDVLTYDGVVYLVDEVQDNG